MAGSIATRFQKQDQKNLQTPVGAELRLKFVKLLYAQFYHFARGAAKVGQQLGGVVSSLFVQPEM